MDMRVRHAGLLILVAVLVPMPLAAQGTPADYQRSADIQNRSTAWRSA